MDRRFPKLALFDLDGTLLDSAPDFLAVVNRMRAERGDGPLGLDALRPVVSKGARAMTGVAFPGMDPAQHEALIPEFLDIYRHELGRHGAPFDGILELLAALESAGSTWGIVTNKPEALARLLMPLLGWETRCAVLIGGDTLPARKPDPLPLLHAAERLGVAPGECVYVGDDERDIIAARAAGMPSVVALWGYRPQEDDPFAWKGDALIPEPRALCDPSAWPAS